MWDLSSRPHIAALNAAAGAEETRSGMFSKLFVNCWMNENLRGKPLYALRDSLN